MSEISDVLRATVEERFPQPNEEERRVAIDQAVNGLLRDHPEMSARHVLAGWQKVALVGFLFGCAIGAYVNALVLGEALISSVVLLYIATLVERFVVFKHGLHIVQVPPRRTTMRIPNDELPRYTILIPAYNEPEIVPILLAFVGAFDYPPDRLEVLLVVEEDDSATIGAVMAIDLPAFFRMLLVPEGGPRTKPKACNYALQFATGDLVTIYDAEDRPEPSQLRRAVETFNRSGPSTVCLQARLNYFNADQNLLTRWFTVDYTTWFSLFLPGLAALRLPIPLGGTSNHIRIEALRAVGGWDPFNVTEDADLGIRLVRRGLQTGVLDSVTYEEANSDAINWVRQRSRWYKGYMQTWLVHFRRPVELYRELGWHGFLSVTLLTGATPLLSGVNLFSWVCTMIFIIGTPTEFVRIFPAPIVYLGTIAALIGNASVVYVSVLACRQTSQTRLAWAALTYPIYWILMAVAAVKAFWQLAVRPSYWEKTVHGLTDTPISD